jgi:8-amino-7-oxononanoate synthase
MKEIKNILKIVDQYNLYPDLKILSGSAIPEIIVNDKKVISFCSNNYLGLAASDKVKQAAIDSIKMYGAGAGGSRLLSGNLDIHYELERTIADFKQSEDAIIFTAGFMANFGVISPIMDLLPLIPRNPFASKGVIFSDELNHASIIDACRFSKAKTVVYRHCDMNDLGDKLKRYRRERKLIVTDGVFSMDGDIAPLDKIYDLSKKYNAMVMVDDAHATGILGKTGRGTAEYFNLPHDENVITMGTFSKSLGAAGGFIAGSKDLIRYLRIASRTYMFSAAMPPGTAGGLIAAFAQIKNNPRLRKQLWENTNCLRQELQDNGFDTLNSVTPIIPVLIGDEHKAIGVAAKLFLKGFFAPCVRWPAVEKGKARIRFTVMSLHTKAQIENLIAAFKKIVVER